MKSHTSGFKNAITQMGRQLKGTITYGQTTLEEEIHSITPHYEADLLKSVMKQLDLELTVDIPLETTINCQIGILVNGNYEMLNFGDYVVYSSEKQEDTKTYKIICYDKMVYAMKQNESLDITYPISIRNYLVAIANRIGLTVANTTFYNQNMVIDDELYVGLEYTYRDILDEIAQTIGGIIYINANNQIDVKYPANTNDTIDEDFLKDINVGFGEKYGPINSIVLSRSGESDNVYLRDEQSVQENGLCEIKIVDNQIMNFNNRSDFLPGILQALDGLEYYINNFNSSGILYYEVGDLYSIQVGEQVYKSIMLNDEIIVTTGIEEIIHTDKPEQTVTDYTKADKTDRRINQTYLIVDKQNQTIESVVSNVSEQNQKIAQVTQTVNEINSKISDMADVTISGESYNGYVSLENVNTSQPINIKIHPTTQSIDFLYPRSSLYPGSNVYPKAPKIKFVNTSTSEIFYWTLPTSLWYYDANTYDDLDLSYGDGTAPTVTVNRKCSIDSSGNISALATPTTESYTYPASLVLSDGNYEIYLEGYSNAYLYVQLMASNIYTEQFATKVEMNSQFIQTENMFNLKLEEKLDGEDFTGANIVLAINNDVSSATIDADKISLNGKTINLTSNDIKINSTNFNVDTDGNMSCNNANITGGEINLSSSTNLPKITITNPNDNNIKMKISSGIITGSNSSGRETVKIFGNIGAITLYDDYGQSSIFMTASDGQINCVSLTQTSKEQEKKNFEKFENALDIIKDIDIYKYHLKDEKDIDKKHIGFVIGDKFNYSKEVTSKDNDGVDIYSFVSLCCQAIKEQQEQIEELKNEIKILKEGK